jgi:hypothetical protein
MASSPSERLIGVDQLQAITGYDRWGDIARCLDVHGVRYFLGKGGRPWTTIDLINAAMGVFPFSTAEGGRGFGTVTQLGPDDV